MRLKTLFEASVGLLACTGLQAQTMLLNTSKKDLIAAFGEPSRVIPLSTKDTNVGEYLYYGDNCFFFIKGSLTRMDIASRHFTLHALKPEGIKVGDDASFITHGSRDLFKNEVSNGAYQVISCTVGNGEDLIRFHINNNIITGISVSKAVKKLKYTYSEFREFFRTQFKPAEKIPQNSLWPADMIVSWKKAAIREAEDGLTATCCVPFAGKMTPSASYSGKNCPEVASRLVITKILDDSDRFRQSIISLVPKPGLAPGEEFTGLIVYNNANSGTAFAWEYYEKGYLIHSKFPAAKATDRASDITVEVRQAQKLFYLGGKEGISDDDWAMIASNRVNVTRIFGKADPKWDEDRLLIEKMKYAFASSENPIFVQSEFKEVGQSTESSTVRNAQANGAAAEGIDLGISKEKLIATLGEPEKKRMLNGLECLYYGDSYFAFIDGALAKMTVKEKMIPLMILKPGGIRPGDPASLVTDSPEGTFIKGKANDDSYRYFEYKKGPDDRKIAVRIKDDAIMSYSLYTIFRGDIPIQSFRSYHSNRYKPTSNYPENSPWPGEIKVSWDRAVIRHSEDARFSTCCAPFEGEITTYAKYSGKKCPPIAGRIAIAFRSSSDSSYRRDFISLIPKAGLAAGDDFTGLLVYTNTNSGEINGWEYYGNGKLMYCDFPTNNASARVSKANSEIRSCQKLVFTGGENGLSEDDWALIAANRIGATMAFSNVFPEGWNEETVIAEKGKYVFSTKNTSDTPNVPKSRATDQTGRQAAQVPVDDTPLPKFVGKSDNLSSIIRLKDSPLKLEFDYKKSTRGEDEYVVFLTCENEDWCDYTIKMENGMLYRLYHGRSTIEDIQGNAGYWWFRGDAISKVNAQYPYAMPVAPGTKVKFMNDPREQHRSFALLTKTGEPAFAMRAGRVCKTDNDNSVLVVHMDGTFAAYMNVDERTVYPGDSVNPGDPIGKCGAGKLSISIFYLDRNKIQSRIDDYYTHLTPYFRTEGGDVKLEAGVEYTSFIDTDLITKEMSGIQKKNYLKKSGK